MAYRYTGSTKQKPTPKRKTTVGGSSNVKSSKRISWKFAAPLIAIVSLVGGYTVFRSFAAEPVIAPQNGKLIAYDYGEPKSGFNNGMSVPFWFDLAAPDVKEPLPYLGYKGPDIIPSGSTPKFVLSQDNTRLIRFRYKPLAEDESRADTSKYQLVAQSVSDWKNVVVLHELPFDLPEPCQQGIDEVHMPYHIFVSADNKVYFTSSGCNRSMNLYSVGMDGTKLTKFNVPVDFDRLDAITSDGRIIFWSDSDRNRKVMSSEGVVDEALTHKAYANDHQGFAYSTVNDEYISSVETNPWTPNIGSLEHRIVNVDNNETRLTIKNSTLIAMAGKGNESRFSTWSPDGKYVVAVVYDKENLQQPKDIVSLIIDSQTGELVKAFDGRSIGYWQPLPPAAEEIPTKKPEEPAPPNPTPTPEPEEPPSKRAPVTTYTEDATKLVAPTNTPYIQRVTSPSKYIIIKPQAYTYQQYISFADKTAVTNFLETQQTANKKVKLCVVTRTSPYTSMLMLRKLSGTTTHNITITKNTLGKKYCTPAITVTSTMTTNPIMQVATAQAGDVLIDTASIELE